MIHIIREPARPDQMQDMLTELEAYVKVAVDIRRGIVAGGGALHADCEAALLEDGSRQEDIWGADWIPSTGEVRYEALINIRPGQGNLSVTLEQEHARQQVGRIVRELMEEK